MKHARIAALLRISLGWIFLWAFLDKLFGWSFATKPEAAWLVGGSPTTGYLTYATKGPFASLFQSLANSPWVDALFMAGLLGIGVGLLFGIAMKLVTRAGTLMLVLMYLSALPPAHNPVIDDHIIYVLVLLLLPNIEAEKTLSISSWWKNLSWIKTCTWLS